jgi:hypothetical protein
LPLCTAPTTFSGDRTISGGCFNAEPDHDALAARGPVEVQEVNVAADQRAIAIRYLGPKLAERYLTSMAQGLATEVLITLRPERWWSVDFSQVKL